MIYILHKLIKSVYFSLAIGISCWFSCVSAIGRGWGMLARSPLRRSIWNSCSAWCVLYFRVFRYPKVSWEPVIRRPRLFLCARFEKKKKKKNNNKKNKKTTTTNKQKNNKQNKTKKTDILWRGAVLLRKHSCTLYNSVTVQDIFMQFYRICIGSGRCVVHKNDCSPFLVSMPLWLIFFQTFLYAP